MYKMFCRNLDNYLKMQKDRGFVEDFRLIIAKPLVVMADPDLYKKTENENSAIYDEVNNVVYEIDKNKDRYPSFKAFSWELWGYGFEKKESPLTPKHIIEEQLKLIDLLLSCHYWIAA